eukprot:scpid7201/ scgid35406/ 
MAERVSGRREPRPSSVARSRSLQGKQEKSLLQELVDLTTPRAKPTPVLGHWLAPRRFDEANLPDTGHSRRSVTTSLVKPEPCHNDRRGQCIDSSDVVRDMTRQMKTPSLADVRTANASRRQIPRTPHVPTQVHAVGEASGAAVQDAKHSTVFSQARAKRAAPREAVTEHGQHELPVSSEHNRLTQLDSSNSPVQSESSVSHKADKTNDGEWNRRRSARHDHPRQGCNDENRRPKQLPSAGNKADHVTGDMRDDARKPSEIPGYGLPETGNVTKKSPQQVTNSPAQRSAVSSAEDGLSHQRSERIPKPNQLKRLNLPPESALPGKFAGSDCHTSRNEMPVGSTSKSDCMDRQREVSHSPHHDTHTALPAVQPHEAKRSPRTTGSGATMTSRAGGNSGAKTSGNPVHDVLSQAAVQLLCNSADVTSIKQPSATEHDHTLDDSGAQPTPCHDAREMSVPATKRTPDRGHRSAESKADESRQARRASIANTLPSIIEYSPFNRDKSGMMKRKCHSVDSFVQSQTPSKTGILCSDVKLPEGSGRRTSPVDNSSWSQRAQSKISSAHTTSPMKASDKENSSVPAPIAATSPVACQENAIPAVLSGSHAAQSSEVDVGADGGGGESSRDVCSVSMDSAALHDQADSRRRRTARPKDLYSKKSVTFCEDLEAVRTVQPSKQARRHSEPCTSMPMASTVVGSRPRLPLLRVPITPSSAQWSPRTVFQTSMTQEPSLLDSLREELDIRVAEILTKQATLDEKAESTSGRQGSLRSNSRQPSIVAADPSLPPVKGLRSANSIKLRHFYSVDDEEEYTNTSAGSHARQQCAAQTKRRSRPVAIATFDLREPRLPSEPTTPGTPAAMESKVAIDRMRRLFATLQTSLSMDGDGRRASVLSSMASGDAAAASARHNSLRKPSLHSTQSNAETFGYDMMLSAAQCAIEVQGKDVLIPAADTDNAAEHVQANAITPPSPKVKLSASSPEQSKMAITPPSPKVKGSARSPEQSKMDVGTLWTEQGRRQLLARRRHPEFKSVDEEVMSGGSAFLRQRKLATTPGTPLGKFFPDDDDSDSGHCRSNGHTKCGDDDEVGRRSPPLTDEEYTETVDLESPASEDPIDSSPESPTLHGRRWESRTRQHSAQSSIQCESLDRSGARRDSSTTRPPSLAAYLPVESADVLAYINPAPVHLMAATSTTVTAGNSTYCQVSTSSRSHPDLNSSGRLAHDPHGASHASSMTSLCRVGQVRQPDQPDQQAMLSQEPTIQPTSQHPGKAAAACHLATATQPLSSLNASTSLAPGSSEAASPPMRRQPCKDHTNRESTAGPESLNTDHLVEARSLLEQLQSLLRAMPELEKHTSPGSDADSFVPPCPQLQWYRHLITVATGLLSHLPTLVAVENVYRNDPALLRYRKWQQRDDSMPSGDDPPDSMETNCGTKRSWYASESFSSPPRERSTTSGSSEGQNGFFDSLSLLGSDSSEPAVVTRNKPIANRTTGCCGSPSSSSPSTPAADEQCRSVAQKQRSPSPRTSRKVRPKSLPTLPALIAATSAEGPQSQHLDPEQSRTCIVVVTPPPMEEDKQSPIGKTPNSVASSLRSLPGSYAHANDVARCMQGDRQHTHNDSGPDSHTARASTDRKKYLRPVADDKPLVAIAAEDMRRPEVVGSAAPTASPPVRTSLILRDVLATLDRALPGQQETAGDPEQTTDSPLTSDARGGPKGNVHKMSNLAGKAPKQSQGNVPFPSTTRELRAPGNAQSGGQPPCANACNSAPVIKPACAEDTIGGALTHQQQRAAKHKHLPRCDLRPPSPVTALPCPPNTPASESESSKAIQMPVQQQQLDSSSSSNVDSGSDDYTVETSGFPHYPHWFVVRVQEIQRKPCRGHLEATNSEERHLLSSLDSKHDCGAIKHEPITVEQRIGRAVGHVCKETSVRPSFSDPRIVRTTLRR